MSLFQEKNYQPPLAERMRPKNFNEFVGQEHLIGSGKLLRKAIENDQLFSMIFWGPPGSGKTTLAKIIAERTNSRFIYFSAVETSTTEIKKIVQEARQSLKAYGQRTILFLDEIHRFNKAQQAIFLPYVEDGSIILIASTTENPSFEVISPLLSRCRVFVLKSLGQEEIKKILKRALADKEKGLGQEKIEIKEEVLNFLAENAFGDGRVALNTLELAAKIASKNKKGVKIIDRKTVQEAFQKKTLLYDKKGEEHYNLISAFIKSLRGSDVDASLYWLARMLEAGEDPEFIARRMIIFASEDIGNTNPNALVVATSTAQALEFVGLPEAELNLAQAVIYLAKSPKSNAVLRALSLAKEEVSKTGPLPVPLHLRNPETKLMKNLGYGKNYQYPHHFPQSKVIQEYLPRQLKRKKFYQP
ncbi:MAG: replication-associated recombination protein A [Patescibacteria group bacterium]|nr:replication-associated recombination protein A [Patescibacteria group bacterium]